MGLGSAPSLREKVKQFRNAISTPLEGARRIGWADVVVGIPFYGEFDTLPGVVRVAREGLLGYSQGKRCVVVAAGSPAGGEALKALRQSVGSEDTGGIRNLFFLLEDGYDGKGWAQLAILEIARELGSHVVILEADLVGSTERAGDARATGDDQGRGEAAGAGFRPEWINLLLEPVQRHGADLVLPRFLPEYAHSPISRRFICPLMAAVYGWRLPEVLGGEVGISSKLVNLLCREALDWTEHAGGYGVDVWLVASALVNNARIYESLLGEKVHKASPAKRRYVFRQVAAALFDLIGRQSHWWEGRHGIVETPVAYVGGFTSRRPRSPEAGRRAQAIALLEFGRSLGRFKKGFSIYDETLLRRVLPDDVYQRLKSAARAPAGSCEFPADLWARCTYFLLSAYTFREGLSKEDLIAALGALFDGRLGVLAGEDGASAVEDAEFEAFLEAKPEFLARWRKEEEVRRPFLPKVAYWEFIPGVSLALPQEIKADDGSTVSVTGVYEGLVREYKAQLDEFWGNLSGWLEKTGSKEQIYGWGGIRAEPLTPGGPVRAIGSQELAGALERLFLALERDIQVWLPGDMADVEALRESARSILKVFMREKAFIPHPSAVSRILRQHPPVNLMTRLGCSSLGTLLARFHPRDVLALAGWTEHREYVSEIRGYMREHLSQADFEESDLEVMAVKQEDFPALVEAREVSALSRIAGRIVVSTLGKNLGGLFPRLRYFTTIAKNAVEAERFYEAWRFYARDREGFIEKVMNSIEGHRAEGILSAHNLFENGHQRVLVERIKCMAAGIRRERGADPCWLQLAEELELAASCYHLAATFPDGVFVPCSVWTWSSFSFKGGKGVPGPLSLHVERDWFVAELVMRLYEGLGGDRAEVSSLIRELAAQGKEYEDITVHLFGRQRAWTPAAFRAGEAPAPVSEPELPAAGKLKRYEGNPILLPVAGHWWESKYVLNPAAIRLRGKIYLVYRAFGEDAISRLGLAVSEDGFTITDRLPTPIFEPQREEERRGCEDPRLAVIGDAIYMLYTAYDGVTPQIGIAAITVGDFVAGRWDRWERLGLAFPGLPNKDAVLYPVRFGGKYAMYHRIAPSMWLSYADEMRCPWPREGYTIVMGPRSGFMWDAIKIGAGSQPLKTRFGWLSIYHGVDYALVYRLGVMLTALDDPGKLLYRSPNAVLEPEAPYEKSGDPGRGIKSWVPNVVFTCGAVPSSDKELLEAEDEILVYYGAGDAAICVATATVKDLVPGMASTE